MHDLPTILRFPLFYFFLSPTILFQVFCESTRLDAALVNPGPNRSIMAVIFDICIIDWK